MSICMYARISKKCISVETFGKIITDFFLPIKDIIIQKDKDCLTYENIYENGKVLISFIDDKKPPYNVYDSCLCNGEFEYKQLIIFDIKKEEVSIDVYRKILDFCFYLKEVVECNILVTSDVHDEICLLEEQNVMWSNNFSES